jgi:hypothetical protein
MRHSPSATPDGGQAAATTTESRGLPLLRARTWAIAFLLFAVVLAVVLAQTMPAFFRAAYHLG